MKTPMQELIEHLETWMLDDKHVQDNPMKYEEYMVQHANQMVSVKRDFVILCESMLEKEKEVMCEFALNYGDEINDQNNWRSPRNRTNYEVIQDCYNEIFNTKEKWDM